MVCAAAAERPAVRSGGKGKRKSRERHEDGADDHLKQTQTRESVRCFCQGGAQSRREAHRLAEQQ